MREPGLVQNVQRSGNLSDDVDGPARRAATRNWPTKSASPASGRSNLTATGQASSTSAPCQTSAVSSLAS